ncbi:hypothetical protein KC341_g57 [Hortaea werneckii]|nr:hypothetical protein KC341_g57 [Hortaea werneckii]
MILQTSRISTVVDMQASAAAAAEEMLRRESTCARLRLQKLPCSSSSVSMRPSGVPMGRKRLFGASVGQSIVLLPASSIETVDKRRK